MPTIPACTHSIQFDEEAGKLVRLPADVIVTNGSEWVRAVQAASWTVPIVIMGGVDPIADGFVTSLARPDMNVTGVAHAPPEVDLKRLQLLVEGAGGVQDRLAQ